MLIRIIILLLLAFIAQSGHTQCPNLIWADEFDGNSLNLNNWSFQIGDGCDIGLCGWGNNELQSYQQANAQVANGELSITARNERRGSSNYTSTRIRSIDKVDFTYGRIEARIQLPSGGGLWPAFWMLSTEEPYGFWPQSGEIDIMEWVGNQKAKVHGTLHFGQPSPNNSQTGATITSIDGDFGNEYHVYAVEWEEDVIRWYFDDFLFSTKTRADLSPERWPFDHDFHLLLNLAVGGNFGGPVENGIFPATMKVDYVRLYDGNKLFIQGDRFLTNTNRRGQYTIGNLSPGTRVTWSGPSGVSILSGQGTSTAQVQWINQGGLLTATVETPCGDQVVSIEIAPGVFRSGSLENFDDQGLATLGFSTGVLTEVQNPLPSTLNSSARVGRYRRDANSPFDVLVYEVEAVLGNVDAYVDGDKQMFIDVFTDAPIGTEIIVQLETAAAKTSDYPAGRHSRYQSFTTASGQWQRLGMQFLDRPDSDAPSSDIIQIPILFDPGSGSGATFYFDNFDLYEEATTVSARSLKSSAYELTLRENPVGDFAKVLVGLDNADAAQLVLTNSIGQHVQRYTLSAQTGRQEIQLDTARLPVGVYTITLMVNGRAMHSIAMVK